MPNIKTGLKNYVKFVRGTPTAFNNLQEKNPDTLYFISDSPEAKIGQLYLGNKLIGGGATSLSQLNDIGIDTSILKDGYILVYDQSQDKWIPREGSSIIGDIGIMQGATETENGTSGLTPIPTAGEQNLFLQANGKWSTVPAKALQIDEDIFTNNSVGELTLKDYDFAPVKSVPFKNENGNITWEKSYTKEEIDNLLSGYGGKISRKIVDNYQDINKDAEDALNYLYMVPNGAGDIGNLYDEYLVIESKDKRHIEKLSSSTMNVDLSNYVKQSTYNQHLAEFNLFQTQVGNLDNLNLDSTNTNLVEQVNYLSDKLTWHSI